MDLTDNVIEEVQKKEGLIASFLDTLPEKALNLGIRIGLALVFFFIGMQLIRLIRKIIRKSMNRAGAETGVPLRYNNDKQKKPLFSRGLSVCRLLFNSFSKLKIDENYKEKRRLFY